MSTPIGGAALAADRLRSVLAGNLQTAVDAIRAELSFADDITINDVVRAASWEPATRPGSVLVSVERANDAAAQVYNYAGPTRREVALRARAQVWTADLSTIDQRRDIVGEAICRVADGYLRRDSNPASILFVRDCRVEYAASSPRQREQVTGLRARTIGAGSAGQDNVDPVDVVIELTICVQRPAPF